MFCNKFVMTAVALFTATAFADTYYADASMKVSGDGLTPQTAKKTIQEAVDLCAENGHTVMVAEGLYNEGVNVCLADSKRARVVITNQIYLVASGAKENTIVAGSFDDTDTGLGPDAVRGIYIYYTGSGEVGKRTAGSVINGFTICNGATDSGSANDNRGGGLTLSGSYALNCIVSNCVAKRGGGIYGGTAVRCLVSGCATAASDQHGTAAWGTTFLNSLIVRQRGSARLFTYPGTLVNCTLSGNNGTDYGYTTSKFNLYNTICTDNDFTKFHSSTYTVASNCVIASGTTGWSASRCGNVHTNTSAYGFAAPALGDWRPSTEMGAADYGKAEYLALVTLPEDLEDQRYLDYYGKAIPKTGNITCGAAQEISEATRLVTFDGNTGWEIDGYGALPTVMTALNYIWADDYPGMFKIRKSNASLTNLVWYQQSISGASSVRLNPDLQNWTGFVALGDAGATNTISVLAPSEVFYVATNGDDDNNDGSYGSPFATIQKAVDSTPNGTSSKYKLSVIVVRAGTYQTGGSDNARVQVYNKTGTSTWWYKNMRIVGESGAAQTTIAGARGADADGYGDGALACCYFQLPVLLQGFTLTGGYNKSSGAAVYGNSSGNCQIADCILTGNQGGNAIAYTTSCYRCRFENNVLTEEAAAEVAGKSSDYRSYLVNSEIAHSGTGWAVGDYVDMAFSAVNGMCNGTKSRDNLYYASIVPGGQTFSGEGAKYSFAHGEALSGNVANCKNGNVRCVSFNKGDFRLKDVSPALGMVTFDPTVSSYLYSLDMDGSPLKLTALAGNTAGPRQNWSVKYEQKGFVVVFR